MKLPSLARRAQEEEPGHHEGEDPGSRPRELLTGLRARAVRGRRRGVASCEAEPQLGLMPPCSPGSEGPWGPGRRCWPRAQVLGSTDSGSTHGHRCPPGPLLGPTWRLRPLAPQDSAMKAGGETQRPWSGSARPDWSWSWPGALVLRPRLLLFRGPPSTSASCEVVTETTGPSMASRLVLKPLLPGLRSLSLK